jgi:hypothetical protein
MAESPLFVPLKTEWFEAFRSGAKVEEWRRYGGRWNETSCRIGRPVVLSLGYTRTRLTGFVIGFRIRVASKAAATIYGEGTRCAVIRIRLTRR